MPAPRGSKVGRVRTNRSGRGWFLPASMVVILGIGLGIIYFYAQKHAVEISTENLCPDSGNIPEVAAVLLDVTDQTSPAEQVQIRQTLDEIKEALPRFGRLRLYVLSHDLRFGQEAVVDLCNPGTGENLSVLYQNPTLAKNRWKERFSDVLDQALESASARAPSEKSEILEAIRSISIEYLSDPANRSKARSLFVISDFLQHVPGGFTQYRTDQASAEQFLSSQYARSVAMDLRGINIELFYIDRPQYARYQTSEHIKFWATTFKEFGGHIARIKRLFGG